MEPIALNTYTVNLAAVKQNIQAIRAKLAPYTRVMVMVKALAYGTEEIRMATFLKTCGVDILGVAFVDEGVNLKRSGASQAVFSLNALPIEAALAVHWGIEVGVSCRALIEALAKEATAQQKQAKVHLNIDTGMGRLGCRPEDALELAALIAEHPSLQLEGVFTHLACSESPEADQFTRQQYALLETVIKCIEGQGISVRWRHAANSSAVLRHNFPACNMVRVGLAIFGLHGSETQTRCDLKLALSLKSHIAGINQCREGETVGYGRAYRIQQPNERIAILPLGYFDGIHRHYSGKGQVMIRGKRASMIGTICMDYMMVDITHIPEAQVGDEVLIFGINDQGHYLAPEELAAHGGSVAHELISCLGPRIKRHFVYE
ncbi:MAG: alanine racemase [Chlamydiales bacterium]|nr:alanine racemase [Chlamydiales bacterium]